MTSLQQKLVDHLEEELKFLSSRRLWLAPAERSARQQFFRDAIAEVKRLVKLEETIQAHAAAKVLFDQQEKM